MRSAIHGSCSNSPVPYSVNWLTHPNAVCRDSTSDRKRPTRESASDRKLKTTLCKGPMNTEDLTILWISCCDGRSGAELLEECRRLCAVTKCGPNRALKALAGEPRVAAVFEFDDPEPTHLQLLQSVKRRYPSVPIVMITEAHSEDLAVWAFRARVWNYLVKPVPLRELKVNLSQLIKLAARRRGSGARSIERPAAMLPTAQSPADPCSEAAMMRRAAEYIHLNFMSRLSVDALARECNMNRFTFSRLFRRTYGCSYRDYVMRLRIDRACKVLSGPNVSVTEAAGNSGFVDSSYFARVFRRHTGKTPMQFAQLGTDERLALQHAQIERAV
jgi:AraC-like DNA-binding protein